MSHDMAPTPPPLPESLGNLVAAGALGGLEQHVARLEVAMDDAVLAAVGSQGANFLAGRENCGFDSIVGRGKSPSSSLGPESCMGRLDPDLGGLASDLVQSAPALFQSATALLQSDDEQSHSNADDGELDACLFQSNPDLVALDP
jgi:hypothetical protein